MVKKVDGRQYNGRKPLTESQQCLKWMPAAFDFCGRKLNHKDQCRSRRSMAQQRGRLGRYKRKEEIK